MRLPTRRWIHADTRHLLRELLRETAQSVAVVTVRRPPAPTPTDAPYHGATLSSFSSIALDPHPLVAFSLRVPSRMASFLNAHVASPSPSAHLVINVLSAAQPHLATCFARPDVHPRPFDDPRVRYALSGEGIPVLSGALGALSCRLVGLSMSLAGLGDRDALVEEVEAGTGLASELFIARVVRVERVPLPEDAGQQHELPLLYHRRRYTTVEKHEGS